MENIRTQNATEASVHHFSQDFVKNWKRSLPTWFHCELTGLGISMPILAQGSQE